MDFYLIIVVILFILAISDLVVGVSNDAVNFLNSAIGSKVAPRYIIMIIASVGILIGTTFSSGLMEVARKGIFNPEQFLFPDIMVVFLAVMLTDVLLLDMFNTFGLPTSTTVSIVFELLGSAVAVALIKIASASQDFAELINYINTSKALAIIFGILLSVVVAFSVGAIVQFLVRVVFTFDFKKRVRRYGAIWGGIALTVMTFFILIKGAKGSSFMDQGTSEWILKNIYSLAIYSFIFWAVLLQLVTMFTKINILKPVVLIGTFALALAFAANDLVNFIGVPLAGLSSYVIGSQSSNPGSLSMVALTEKVQTDTILLVLAGLIMVITLWFSSKAKTVTKTELNLGRQIEGYERFEASVFSRTIVRMSISLVNFVKMITPNFVINFVDKRLDSSVYIPEKTFDGEKPSWDLLRASVNLTVASVLISIGTSLKLPLSTTYVTFMVAMGSSLADRSWGRESAVYRVNGVVTVIGGWFFTAFMAFTVSAIMAIIIYFGDLPAIIILALIAGYVIFRTHLLHKDVKEEEEEIEKKYNEDKKSDIESVQTWLEDIQKFFSKISSILADTLEGLSTEDRVLLKQSRKKTKKLKKSLNLLIADLFNTVKITEEDDLKEERRYGKIMASVQEIYSNVKNISQSCLEHVENNHKKPIKAELFELKELNNLLFSQIDEVNRLLKTKDFGDSQQLDKHMEDFQNQVRAFDRNQINRLREAESGSRNTLLLLGLLSDMENISNRLSNLINLIRKNYLRFEKRLAKKTEN